MDNIEKVRSALRNKVKEINKLGWIKCHNKSSIDSVKEIESVINNVDNSYITLNKFEDNGFKKELFILNPSGPENTESTRLREEFGKNVDNTRLKALRIPLYVGKKTLYNNSYYFELIVDKKKEKVFIKISDLTNNQIEKIVYWTFKDLEKILYLKSKKIALVEHDNKYVNLDEYYRIVKITLFEKVNFDKFIKELSKGNVRIYLKIGVYRNGLYYGKTHDHGATFEIYDYSYKEIFDKYYIYAKNEY